MSSVLTRPFAQNTGNFVTIAYYNTSNPEDPPVLVSGCYILLENDFKRWASDYASNYSVVGNVYTALSVGDFETMIGSLYDGLWSEYYYVVPGNPGLIPIGTELKDLGKDIYIGLPGEANILRLRLVQLPGTVANMGKGGAVGYIFIEANGPIFDGGDYPAVGVARL